MKLIIEGTEREIADFAVLTQKQHIARKPYKAIHDFPLFPPQNKQDNMISKHEALRNMFYTALFDESSPIGGFHD